MVLIFSVQRTGGFQGYARLGHEEMCGNPMSRSIEWLKLGDVPFQAARHLLNPWADNNRVQHSRDGQELETSVGENLCQLWERVPSKRQFQFPPPPSCLPMPQFPNMQSPMVSIVAYFQEIKDKKAYNNEDYYMVAMQ